MRREPMTRCENKGSAEIAWLERSRGEGLHTNERHGLCAAFHKKTSLLDYTRERQRMGYKLS